jgi:hypothetical protein
MVDGAAFINIALHHRPPTADLDQALLAAVLVGKGTLFIEAGPGAAAVNRFIKKPGRPNSSNSGSGPRLWRKITMAATVSVKLSPTGAQPGILMTGNPKALR